MDEEKKKEVAVFRFAVIHDLVNGIYLDHGEQERLIREKCDRKWPIPHSTKTRISRSTILRWVRLYKAGNGKLESLYPGKRSDCGKSRALDEEMALSLIRTREELPKATVPRLVEEMKHRGMITPGRDLPLSTAYRFLHCHNLMGRDRGEPEDRRRYESELPNDMWQSDVMHGPVVEVGGRMKKSYLIAFIDDHSRLIPHGEFYPSERLTSFLDAFENALLKRGLPRKLYVDNGSAFRSKHLEHITASLGIALIHSRPYKPEGRGKIERFFRTVRGDFLACLRAPSLRQTGFTGTTMEELNESFDKWLNDTYHQRKHTSTGQSPFKRFAAHMECIRTVPENLRDYFRKVARRRVARDRTITLDGRLYEAPVPLIGKQVTVLYHDYEQVEVTWQGKSYGFLVPVNLNINCRVKRDRNRATDIEASEGSHYTGGRLWSRNEKGKKANETSESKEKEVTS